MDGSGWGDGGKVGRDQDGVMGIKWGRVQDVVVGVK